jgi:hypothetical protein
MDIGLLASLLNDRFNNKKSISLARAGQTP